VIIGDNYDGNTYMGGRVWTNDGAAGVWSTMNFSQARFGAAAHGAEFVESLDRILVKTSVSNEILSIHPTTWVVTTQTTTGGSGIPAAAQGVFGKFRYCEALGGCVYYPEYYSNLWFLATE
jgi:hypothetical protein